MSENTETVVLTEQEQQQRQERFRYTDQTHPLIQLLVNLQLKPTDNMD